MLQVDKKSSWLKKILLTKLTSSSYIVRVKSRTYSTKGIVLKRVNVGETDRIINILTQENGKMTCVAKGVRKITSTKRAFLEPGNLIKGFFVRTKSLPLLTQATLIDDCSQMNQTLAAFRQLSQILEFFEKLFVEQELDPALFVKAVKLRKMIVMNKATSSYTRRILSEIITDLGFENPNTSKHDSISDYISALTNSKMKSFEYLKVK